MQTTGASLGDMTEGRTHGEEMNLLGRIEVIESQPLADRARGYEQLAEELLAELQRSDSDTVLRDPA